MYIIDGGGNRYGNEHLSVFYVANSPLFRIIVEQAALGEKKTCTPVPLYHTEIIAFFSLTLPDVF